MALKTMVLTCDYSYCDSTSDEDYRTEAEALEDGWFILRGPERSMGGDGEKTYCSRECLEADL